MKLGICNEIFDGWELERIFSFAAGLGYDCVEIAPFTIAPRVTDIAFSRRVEIRETAARVGIEIAGLHWILAKTAGFHLTSADREVRRRTAEYLVEIVNCCGDLGGTRIILGSPKQRDLAPEISMEMGRAFAREALQESVRRAEDRGIVICIEPLGPAETNFINTAQEAAGFAAEFGTPAISIILDVKAMSTEGKPVAQIIAEHAGRFAYFHANDPNLKGPGFGDMDYAPIGAALRASGYDGIVSVEVFDFAEGPERIAAESIEHLRKTVVPA